MDNLVAISFSKEDWEFICNAFDHAKHNAEEALHYLSKTQDDRDFYNNEITRMGKLREQIQKEALTNG